MYIMSDHVITSIQVYPILYEIFAVSFLNWNIYQHENFPAVSEAWKTLERGTFEVLGDGFEIVARLQRALVSTLQVYCILSNILF